MRAKKGNKGGHLSKNKTLKVLKDIVNIERLSGLEWLGYKKAYSHSVMLNLFQHLMGLWHGALSSKDPEPSSG